MQPPDDVTEGVTDELLEPLSQCVLAEDPFVEYGIVEHRLRTRFPDLFAAHVAEQGHSMFGPRPYTASSVRFGVALGRLERLGELISEYGPAIGAWPYTATSPTGPKPCHQTGTANPGPSTVPRSAGRHTGQTTTDAGCVRRDLPLVLLNRQAESSGSHVDASSLGQSPHTRRQFGPPLAR